MKFLVGHSGILVALFTCDDCTETFILMSWLILSFNTVLAAPIRTGYEGIRAGVSCYHFDARPLVACCAFYLDLLHQLFQGEVYLQLCGTPYGLFTKFTFKFTLGLLTGLPPPKHEERLFYMSTGNLSFSYILMCRWVYGVIMGSLDYNGIFLIFKYCISLQ